MSFSMVIKITLDVCPKIALKYLVGQRDFVFNLKGKMK